MTHDLTAQLLQFLSNNRGPSLDDPAVRVPPDYGVTGFLRGDVVDMTLTFREGRAYCCMEWGCHLALHPPRWARLRATLESAAVALPERLHLRLTVVVESGAMFFDLFTPVSGQPGRYVFVPSAGQRYEAEAREER